MSPPRTERSGPPAQGPAPESSSRHDAAEHPHDHDTGPSRLDDPELHAEVDRLAGTVMRAALRNLRRIPGVGTPAWWAADDAAKIAGLLVLAEAWLVREMSLGREVRARLKAASVAISTGSSWCDHGPSHASLAARRAEPGSMWQSLDPRAAARWSATASSEGGCVAS